MLGGLDITMFVIVLTQGCSVIRMLESYLGEKDFRNGVKRYLTKHSWANAKNADLWAALTEVGYMEVGYAPSRISPTIIGPTPRMLNCQQL